MSLRIRIKTKDGDYLASVTDMTPVAGRTLPAPAAGDPLRLVVEEAILFRPRYADRQLEAPGPCRPSYVRKPEADGTHEGMPLGTPAPVCCSGLPMYAVPDVSPPRWKCGVCGRLREVAPTEVKNWSDRIPEEMRGPTLASSLKDLPPKPDPVHQGGDALWYFWDTDWARPEGPFAGERDAREACGLYARVLAGDRSRESRLRQLRDIGRYYAQQARDLHGRMAAAGTPTVAEDPPPEVLQTALSTEGVPVPLYVIRSWTAEVRREVAAWVTFAHNARVGDLQTPPPPCPEALRGFAVVQPLGGL